MLGGEHNDASRDNHGLGSSGIRGPQDCPCVLFDDLRAQENRASFPPPTLHSFNKRNNDIAAHDLSLVKNCTRDLV
jgi:hypothetical protein